jgi:hypothetical protein
MGTVVCGNASAGWSSPSDLAESSQLGRDVSIARSIAYAASGARRQERRDRRRVRHQQLELDPRDRIDALAIGPVSSARGSSAA